MREGEIKIPLTQICNLLTKPISCYAYGGSIITIPPAPPEDILYVDNVYFLVEEGDVPDLPDYNIIFALPPSVGRGGRKVCHLRFKGMSVYPMEDA